MILRPCKCGSIPTVKRAMSGMFYTLRLECQCGAHGALMMFAKLADLPRMQQAAEDGWNMGG